MADGSKRDLTGLSQAVELEGAAETSKWPALQLAAFEGPLDLLLHLIERNRVDIHDIPIASITAQYLEVIEAMPALDMDIASEFLLMAATLLQIKARMLLPYLEKKEEGEDHEDPREELVLRLLAYRRAKLLAGELQRRQQAFGNSQLHRPVSAKSQGIEISSEDPHQVVLPRYYKALQNLVRRNELRYAHLKDKLAHILTRERCSLRNKIVLIWQKLKHKSLFAFQELLGEQSSRVEQITTFLAMLELVRMNRIQVMQDFAYAPIQIERKGQADEEDDMSLFLEASQIQST